RTVLAMPGWSVAILALIGLGNLWRVLSELAVLATPAMSRMMPLSAVGVVSAAVVRDESGCDHVSPRPAPSNRTGDGGFIAGRSSGRASLDRRPAAADRHRLPPANEERPGRADHRLVCSQRRLRRGEVRRDRQRLACGRTA